MSVQEANPDSKVKATRTPSVKSRHSHRVSIPPPEPQKRKSLPREERLESGVGHLLDVHLDATLLPLAKAFSLGLNSDTYKNPVVVVIIAVIHKSKAHTPSIHQPALDWGDLRVAHQVPRMMPSFLSSGSTVIHGILTRKSKKKSEIRLTGLVDGQAVEYRVQLEVEAPYMTDPYVFVDALQLLQDQLLEETKNSNLGRRASASNKLKINTACQRHTSGSLDVGTVSENEGELAKSPSALMKRKLTPAVSKSSADRIRRISLKNRIEAASFVEENEDWMDEFLSKRVSRMSQTGRMSRLSRRLSQVSLAGTSEYSLQVNPPGSAREVYSRMSHRKRHHRRASNISYIEYRQASGEVSDMDSESDNIMSVSSLGENISEYSVPIGKYICMCSSVNNKDRAEDNSCRCCSSEGRSSTTATPGTALHSPTENSRLARFGPQHTDPQRHRRPTPASQTSQQHLSKFRRRLNSIINEEIDPGEETETDGYISQESSRRRASLRRKRFSKRRITHSDMLNFVKLGSPGCFVTSHSRRSSICSVVIPPALEEEQRTEDDCNDVVTSKKDVIEDAGAGGDSKGLGSPLKNMSPAVADTGVSQSSDDKTARTVPSLDHDEREQTTKPRVRPTQAQQQMPDVEVN